MEGCLYSLRAALVVSAYGSGESKNCLIAQMVEGGRVPLWLIACIGGMAVLTLLGLFIYGSYSGLGSSI